MDADQEKRFRFRARLEAEEAASLQGPELQAAPQEPFTPDPQVERAARLDNAVSASEAMFPRASKAFNENRSYWNQVLGAGLDLASLPGRFTAASSTQKLEGGNLYHSMGSGAYGAKPEPGRYETVKPGGPSFNASMADTEGQNLAGKIVRDPALIPSLAMGGGVLGLAGKYGLTGLKAATIAGAAEGITSAGIHQADAMNSGGTFNPGRAALEVGLNAAMPGAAKVVGKGVALGNKTLGKLAEGLSGASEEALRTFGWGVGKGAKKLAEASGKQGEIGRQLVAALDNLDDFLPEKEIINKALPEFPPVNANNVLSTLRGAKVDDDIAFGTARSANSKIDDLVGVIEKNMDESGSIPAEKFRRIRIRIDKEIGDAFGKEGSDYINALKSARHQAANDLVIAAESTGNQEYVQVMKSMADKLQKADRLSQFLGKSSQTREARSEAFVSTLFGKNKGERQRAVKEMGEIFGQDFLEQSRLASLAAELGEDGAAGFLPRQFNGRSMLAAGLGLVGGQSAVPGSAFVPLTLSSPKLAAGILTGGGIAEQVLNRAGVQDALSTGARTLTRPAFRNNQNPKAPR